MFVQSRIGPCHESKVLKVVAKSVVIDSLAVSL